MCLHLPEDTIVVAHPNIGSLDPDFLVISPRYGIRIVEVKEWTSLHSVNVVHTNGLFIFNNGDKRNPTTQAKKHCDELIQYLQINFPNEFSSFPSVGYAVIHFGFNKIDFSSKFNSLDNNFWKHNIFKNQMDNIDQLLMGTTKFTVKPLSSNVINKITDSITYIDETLIKPTNFEKIDYDGSIDAVAKRKRFYDRITYFVWLPLVIIFIAFLAWGYLNHEPAANNNASISTNSNVSDFVTLEMKVSKFAYDNKSKTKFLTLEDSTGTLEAVIFNGTSVPYINVGEIYVFTGKIGTYIDKIQLTISKVEQK